MKRTLWVVLCILALVFAGTAMAETPKMGGTLVFGRGGDSVGFSGPSSSRGEGGGGRRPSANAPAFEPAGMDDDIPFRGLPHLEVA